VPTTESEEGDDRFEVAVHIGDPLDLGAEFFRWELATAVAGHVLDIDPFDEPNVTESKENTNRVLASLPLPEIPAEDASHLQPWLKEQFRPGDYVSLQAYLPYPWARAGSSPDGLERLRRATSVALGGAPVTAGYGPRFLHSTGQLHKGGPKSVIAVQLVPRRPSAQLPVPDHPFDFATLIGAQAIGDHQSLLNHGRRVLRVAVDDLEELL
jgi:glucose-6-phosphate isomerase/transaldolase/glucose-6-phosphate isomerase